MSTICDDLRAAILQAAMQGKLTKQLPEDGDAEDLLEEIKVEKEKVIKNGLVKKQKNIKPLANIPFDIPESWRWVQLSDLAYVYSGLSYNKKDLDEKIVDEVTVFRGGNISNMSYYFKADDVKIDKKFIPKNELFLRKNQLITPAVTSQSNLGKIARIDIDYPNVVAGGFVLNIVPYVISDDIFSKLFCYFFSSPFYKERCNEIANKSGQAFYNLNRTKLQESAFPLPPLDEQKRIVEKVDELMARVAVLEQSADTLASLKRAFPDDIKASLLQAAMQGKLTKQLPEDGSAEDLLEEIKAEKEKLIAEGKIKKQKPLAPITDDEIPFSIPENWKWVRLNDILDVRDGTHDSPKYVKADVGVPLVTSKNLRNGSIDYSDVKYISIADSEAINQRSKVDINDILMAMIGTIGNPVKVVEEPHYSIKNMALLKHLPENMPNMDYILQVLNWAVSDMKKKSSGGVQKFVSLNFIREYPMPLPPLAEQKRIVECLENLTDIINTVKVLIESK